MSNEESKQPDEALTEEQRLNKMLTPEFDRKSDYERLVAPVLDILLNRCKEAKVPCAMVFQVTSELAGSHMKHAGVTTTDECEGITLFREMAKNGVEVMAVQLVNPEDLK